MAKQSTCRWFEGHHACNKVTSHERRTFVWRYFVTRTRRRLGHSIPIYAKNYIKMTFLHLMAQLCISGVFWFPKWLVVVTQADIKSRYNPMKFMSGLGHILSGKCFCIEMTFLDLQVNLLSIKYTFLLYQSRRNFALLINSLLLGDEQMKQTINNSDNGLTPF